MEIKKEFLAWLATCLGILVGGVFFIEKYGYVPLLLVFILITLLWIIGKELPSLKRDITGILDKLGEIELILKKGFKLESGSSSGNPGYKGEGKEVKTGGGGAFGGFILGVALGLPFGPLFAIIGGVLGAFLGNSLEKLTLKEKRNADQRAKL
jgi:hypothetical protein